MLILKKYFHKPRHELWVYFINTRNNHGIENIGFHNIIRKNTLSMFNPSEYHPNRRKSRAISSFLKKTYEIL